MEKVVGRRMKMDGRRGGAARKIYSGPAIGLWACWLD